MSLHCRIEINFPDNYQERLEQFAIIEMRIDDRGEYYYPTKVTLTNEQEYKFRRSQIEKAYDRTRSIPYLIVAHLVDTSESPTYEILERLPEIRTWKCMVAWQSTIEIVQAQFREKYQQKVCGYDGPFTAG